MNKFIWLVLALVLVLGGILLFRNVASMPTRDDASVATSTDDQSERSGDSEALGDVKEFTVSATNFKFSLETIKVRSGDTVRINFDNQVGTHNLVIDEFAVATKMISGKGQDSVIFTVDKTGSFEYYCSVGNHRDMGMKGTLIVE